MRSSRLSRLGLLVVRIAVGSLKVAKAQGMGVGEGCRILTSEFGSEPWLISIGDRVTVSGGVQFLTHDGVGWLMRDSHGRRFKYGRIEIGSDVFVGNRAIILPGVRIGDRCVIGAGSIVTHSVPSGTVVAGNPARRLCGFDELMERVAKWPARSGVDDLRGFSRRCAAEFGMRPEISEGRV